jgi:MoaA/NifB/PqqE/SkfB family radical SAM enzyme
MGTSYLAIGYECDHQCLCCPLTTYDRLHKRLSFEQIKERISLIKRQDEAPHIVLSGGEPMLHPDFLKILDYVVKEGFLVTVLSNAVRCKNRDFVKSIKDITPADGFEIITAVHSSTPYIHDRLTGVTGSLLDTLEGLDNLVAEDIPFTIKHIFNKISLPTLAETFKYLEEHYPPQVGFQFCTMDYSGRAGKNVEELFVSMDEIRNPVEAVLDDLERKMVKKRSISFIETPFCLTDPYYWKYYNNASCGLDTYIAPNTGERRVAYEVASACGAFYEPCQKCMVKNWCAGTWKTAYKYRPLGLLSPINNIQNK